jgi:hypothetical protein
MTKVCNLLCERKLVIHIHLLAFIIKYQKIIIFFDIYIEKKNSYEIMTETVWLDCDPGTDDALAIIMAGTNLNFIEIRTK